MVSAIVVSSRSLDKKIRLEQFVPAFPKVYAHALECKNTASGKETKDGENCRDGVVAAFVFIFRLEGCHLRSRYRTCGKWLSRRCQLHGSFWQSNRVRRSAWSKTCHRSSAERHSRSASGSGVKLDGRSRCWASCWRTSSFERDRRSRSWWSGSHSWWAWSWSTGRRSRNARSWNSCHRRWCRSTDRWSRWLRNHRSRWWCYRSGCYRCVTGFERDSHSFLFQRNAGSLFGRRCVLFVTHGLGSYGVCD